MSRSRAAGVRGERVDVATADDLVDAVERLQPALIVCDPAVHDGPACDLIASLVDRAPSAELLIVSGYAPVLREARACGVAAAPKRTLFDTREIEAAMLGAYTRLAVAQRLSESQAALPPLGVSSTGIMPFRETALAPAHDSSAEDAPAPVPVRARHLAQPA